MRERRNANGRRKEKRKKNVKENENVKKSEKKNARGNGKENAPNKEKKNEKGTKRKTRDRREETTNPRKIIKRENLPILITPEIEKYLLLVDQKLLEVALGEIKEVRTEETNEMTDHVQELKTDPPPTREKISENRETEIGTGIAIETEGGTIETLQERKSAKRLWPDAKRGREKERG